MSDRFTRSLEFTLGWEGGVADDPADAGGLTKWGVTHLAYDAWRTKRGLAVRSVREMTLKEMRAIYESEYWDPSHAGAANWPLCACIFDCAVNHGIKGGAKLLQRALRIPADGVWGGKTSLAVAEADHPAVALRMVTERRKQYRAIVRVKPSQGRFLAGWMNRCDALEKLCRSGV